MADFKIQGITPAVEKLKLGSSNVSKIYNGSTLVWPPGACAGYTMQNKNELVTAVNLWVSNRNSAISTYGQINTWCTGNVTDMSDLFWFKTTFNDDISNWDVSNVTNMEDMFRNAVAFNQDISSWDVSSVTNMLGMFRTTGAFNSNISGWDVSLCFMEQVHLTNLLVLGM